jgi:hypothetical protein
MGSENLMHPKHVCLIDRGVAAGDGGVHWRGG